MGDDDAVGDEAKLEPSKDKTFEQAKSSSDWNEYQKYDYILNFEYSTLRCATFLNTSVTGASFKNADLYGVNFSNTRLSRADFSGAKNLNTIILKDACFDEEPTLDREQGDWFHKSIKRENCSPTKPPIEAAKVTDTMSKTTGCPETAP